MARSVELVNKSWREVHSINVSTILVRLVPAFVNPLYCFSMSLNHAEWCVLVNWRVGDNSSYELYAAPREGSESTTTAEPLRGNATTAVWVARNRFAALEKNNQVITI